jgi:lipoyl(octanoyl) transferase
MTYYFNAGVLEYETALALQRKIAAERADSVIEDTLILVEHPHTYTLGRSGHPSNLLWSLKECEVRGVSVVQVDRGGDITYHGPGQLVAYPILHLGRPQADGHLPKADYVGYIRKLEEVIICTIDCFGISGFRVDGFSGVWVDGVFGPEKIAAIGIKVDGRGITTHGLALNVDPDLEYFQGIIPCGIPDKGITSLQALLGPEYPDMAHVRQALCGPFEQVFETRLIEVPPDNISQWMVQT